MQESLSRESELKAHKLYGFWVLPPPIILTGMLLYIMLGYTLDDSMDGPIMDRIEVEDVFDNLLIMAVALNV